MISLFLLSCVSKKQQSNSVFCPNVFFSKDHRLYITSEENVITLDNVSYRAQINNYNYVNECIVKNNKIVAELSILFVIIPEKAKKADINIPYYVALLDDQLNIINIQYYKIAGTLNNNETSFIETEIIATQDLLIPIEEIIPKDL